MKYYIWALGCAMNKSDAERIASVFQDTGFTETKNESEADIIITVACSVRQSAIDRIYGKARKWQKIKGKKPLKTILSGCVLERDRKKLAEVFDLIFEIKDLQELKKFLKKSTKSEILNPKQYQNHNNENKKNTLLNFKNWKLIENWKLEIGNSEDYLSINPTRESSFTAYVPISTGCDNFCTYCAVPYTRGREISRPMDEIVAEVRGLVKKGYKEITLLGQNVNSYGFARKSRKTEKQKNDILNCHSELDSESRNKELDSGSGPGMTNHLDHDTQYTILHTDFVNLLKEIDKISGDYRVYFYSNHPKDMSDELIETLPKLKHFPHYIHLPLQSGSNRIIKAMNRHYTREKYLKLVEKIRKAMPDAAITTDIIVGFPGETDEDFTETKNVVKSVKFSMPFIAKYSPRPGTVAAKVTDSVPQKEKGERWQELTNLQEKILEKENKKLVGKHLRILVDSEKKGKYYGRTDSYKVVKIIADKGSPCCTRTALEKQDKKQTTPLGQFVNVKITNSSAWMLKGEAI